MALDLYHEHPAIVREAPSGFEWRNGLLVRSEAKFNFYLPPQFFFSRSVVSIAGQASVGSDTNATTYTFTDVALSPASGTSLHLLIGGRAAAAAQTLSSVSAEGVAATSRVAQSNGFQHAAIFNVLDSTAAPDIVVGWTGGMANMQVGLVSATSVLSLSPVGTNSSTSNGSGSLNVNATAGGLVVGCGTAAPTPASDTWAGATEFYGVTRETSFRYTGASALTAVTETPRTVGLTWGAGGTNNTAVSCSVR